MRDLDPLAWDWLLPLEGTNVQSDSRSRLQSAFELLHGIRWQPEHAKQVARLAVSVFDQLRSVHGLGMEGRDILATAALLHDVGWAIDRKQHHKHSMRLILKDRLDGFDVRQQLMVANVARYHRRALPSDEHRPYCMLGQEDRETVCMLAGILRIADGLDRAHTQDVGSLRVEWEQDACRLVVTPMNGSLNEINVQGALQKADLFEATFRRPVRIVCQPGGPGSGLRGE